MVTSYLEHTFFLIALLSGIPLAVSSVTGLIIAVLQAATQIQEQTITYLAKFCAVSAVTALFGQFFAHEMVSYTQELLMSLASLGRM